MIIVPAVRGVSETHWRLDMSDQRSTSVIRDRQTYPLESYISHRRPICLIGDRQWNAYRSLMCRRTGVSVSNQIFWSPIRLTCFIRDRHVWSKTHRRPIGDMSVSDEAFWSPIIIIFSWTFMNFHELKRLDLLDCMTYGAHNLVTSYFLN